MTEPLIEMLPCELTFDEFIKRIEALGDAEGALADLMKSRRQYLVRLRSQEKALMEQILRLRDTVINRWELREVQLCVEYHTPRHDMKRIWRTDTGMTVREEEMSDEDRQQWLDFDVVKPGDQH